MKQPPPPTHTHTHAHVVYYKGNAFVSLIIKQTVHLDRRLEMEISRRKHFVHFVFRDNIILLFGLFLASASVHRRSFIRGINLTKISSMDCSGFSAVKVGKFPLSLFVLGFPKQHETQIRLENVQGQEGRAARQTNTHKPLKLTPKLRRI